MDVVGNITGVINVNEAIVNGGEEHPHHERKERDAQDKCAGVRGDVVGGTGNGGGRAASGRGERPGGCVGLGWAAV